MAVKTYMGRAFLAPSAKVTGPGSEIWLNIGWNSKGNQLFPDYLPVLQPALDEVAYGKMSRELAQLLDREGVTMQMGMMAMLCCECTCGLSCLCMYMKVKRLNSKVEEIIKRHGGSRVRLEFIQMTTPVPQVPAQMAKDQYGQTLQTEFGGEGCERMEPCWPPLGYNIVVHLPNAIEWPPVLGATPVQAVMAEAPNI